MKLSKLALKEVLKTSTFRQSLITIISSLLNAVAAGLFYLVLARSIGASGYGLFALSTATMALLSTLFDFGSDRGIVKFLPKYHNQPNKQFEILKLAFVVKLLSGSIVFLASICFAPWIATAIFNQPAMVKFIPFVGLGLLLQLFYTLAISYFQAKEQFILWGVGLVGTNLLRLALTLTLLFTKTLTPLSATFLFASVQLIGFVFLVQQTNLSFLKSKIEKETIQTLLDFNKWTTGFSVISAIGSRIDTYLTSYLLPIASVGAYGLAGQITLFLPQIISALGAVTGPKFARFSGHYENSRYIYKSLLFFTFIGIFSVLLIIPVGYIFIRVSGTGYTTAFLPLVILVLSQFIFLVFTPIRDSLLYYFNKPKLFFWMSIAQLLLVSICSLLLIPRYGLVGSGIANLVGQVLLNLISIIMYRHYSK